MLAEAQRAANTTGMERFLAQIGNVAAVKPESSTFRTGIG
jgi:hypothetical protein